MKVKRKIIEIDQELCDGCGQCVTACAECAIEIIDGKAKVVSDNLCDGLGACIGDCPTNALKIIERDADEFDEHAVEKRFDQIKKNEPEEKTLACGCPSTQIQEFVCSSLSDATADQPVSNIESALGHWPVKITLIPATAPFLKRADLLVAADCTPVAYPDFHRNFLNKRVVMTGCPKFDDIQSYVEKFTDIFKTARIKSIMCVIMEVPCCSGLTGILSEAMEKAGITIPIEKIVISNRGNIVK